MAMNDKKKKPAGRAPLVSSVTIQPGQTQAKSGLTPGRPMAPVYDANSSRFARSPGAAPEGSGLAPVYFTRENAPGMGWQERMARNKDLDANYRKQLGNVSLENIAKERTRRALDTTRMSTESSERIAIGQRAGALERAELASRTQKDIRSAIEAGLGARQALGQKFTREEREAGQEFSATQAELNRDAGMQQIRSRSAATLAAGGILEPSQLPEYERTGFENLDPEQINKPVSTTSRFRLLPGQKTTELDVTKGTSKDIVGPPYLIDTQSGTVTIPDIEGGQQPNPFSDEQLSVLDKYWNPETGTWSKDISKASPSELAILKRYDEMQKQRAKQAL